MGLSTEPLTFGAWLKRRRKMLDLTQDELGKLAGCSGAAIRKFEAEERKPSRELAELLARSLQIPENERQSFLQLARGVYSKTTPLVSQVELVAAPARLPPDNLPAPLTSLVDRIQDARAVSVLLNDPDIRWVSLIGPPGIGKTRLSIQSGRLVLANFADGVWFMDLAALEHASHVFPMLNRALASVGVPPYANLDQLAGALKSCRMLLVLDNFEHVTEAAVEIAELLKRCAGLKVLATSRIPLDIYGEHEYCVPPLSTPPSEAVKSPETLMEYEAVQLFMARVRQHQPSLAITPETAPIIVDICTSLEGVPLALELAAASLQSMTLSEMDRVLHKMEGVSWIKLFGTPARDLPARQRTLENVVAWSYTLLNEPQRALFAKLSLFSGWFDQDGVAAICFEDPQTSRLEVRRILDALSNHSLLVRDNLEGIPCWRMLEVIHEYSALQLEPTVKVSLEARFADYFLDKLQAITTAADRQKLNAFFRTNTSNLHAALKWYIREEDTENGFRFAELLDDLWTSRGYFREGLDLLIQLIQLPCPAAPEVRAYCLEQASDLAWQVHDFETAMDLSLQAAELGRNYNLDWVYAWHLNRLGRIYIEQGRYAEAKQVLSESLSLAVKNPERLNPGMPMAQLGEVAFFEVRLDESREILEQALSYLPRDEEIFYVLAQTDLAEIALAHQDHLQAYQRLQLANPVIGRQMRRSLVFLCALAGYLVLSGDDQEKTRKAARFYGAVEVWSERTGVNLSQFYMSLNQSRIQLIINYLNAEEWKKEYGVGRGWSWEKVLAEARAEFS
jgi:predicted ATPase/DNA-binding XRE family transcriptional regulator/Tfp pilus assembly protein PilF